MKLVYFIHWSEYIKRSVIIHSWPIQLVLSRDSWKMFVFFFFLQKMSRDHCFCWCCPQNHTPFLKSLIYFLIFKWKTNHNFLFFCLFFCSTVFEEKDKKINEVKKFWKMKFSSKSYFPLKISFNNNSLYSCILLSRHMCQRSWWPLRYTPQCRRFDSCLLLLKFQVALMMKHVTGRPREVIPLSVWVCICYMKYNRSWSLTLITKPKH